MSFQDQIRAAFRRGEAAEVRRLAEAGVRRARAVVEPADEVEGLYALARLALRQGELGEAERLAEQALDVAVRAADRRLEERPRHVLAAVARMRGDHALARERYLASIELNRDLGQPEQVSSETYNLAVSELHLGNLGQARDLLRTVQERVFRVGDHTFVPYLGIAAAALAAAEGDAETAASMIGFTDSAFGDLGQVPDPDDAAELAAARTFATVALDPDRFAAQYALGAAWDAPAAFGLSWGT